MTVGCHSDGDTAHEQQAAAAGAAATAESKQKLKLVANNSIKCRRPPIAGGSSRNEGGH